MQMKFGYAPPLLISCGGEPKIMRIGRFIVVYIFQYHTLDFLHYF